jgi:hypothetical protein
MNIKQIIITITLILSSLSAQALSIQGVLRNTDGSTVSNGEKTFLFQVYTVETLGSNVWYETKTLNVINGVYSYTLGDGTSMSDLNFGIEYWLGISIDGAAELTPRTKLTLSPYAIMAQEDGVFDNIFPMSGTVAINNPSPSSVMALDVGGYIRNTVGGNYDVWIQGGPSLSGGTNRNLAILGDVENDKLIINAGGEYTNGTILGSNVGIGTSNPTNKLSVDGDADFTGNVGIGTSDLVYKLAVASNTADVLQLSGGDDESTSLNIRNYTSNDSDGQWYFDPGEGGQIVFGTVAGGTSLIERVNVKGELSVSGKIMAPYMASMTGAWDVRISDTGELFKVSSSRRYKQNINEWYDHKKILNANVKTYQMKEGFGVPGENHIGLIAEELHDLGLNQLVIYDKEKRPDAVFYNRVSLYLLGIVKEQDKELNEMKSRLAALETAMGKLK